MAGSFPKGLRLLPWPSDASSGGCQSGLCVRTARDASQSPDTREADSLGLGCNLGSVGFKTSPGAPDVTEG